MESPQNPDSGQLGLLQRFWNFVSSPRYSRTLSLLALLVIAIMVPVTVIVSRQQTELRQKAESSCGYSTPYTCSNDNECFWNGSACQHKIDSSQDGIGGCCDDAAECNGGTCSIANGACMSGVSCSSGGSATPTPSSTTCAVDGGGCTSDAACRGGGTGCENYYCVPADSAHPYGPYCSSTRGGGTGGSGTSCELDAECNTSNLSCNFPYKVFIDGQQKTSGYNVAFQPDVENDGTKTGWESAGTNFSHTYSQKTRYTAELNVQNTGGTWLVACQADVSPGTAGGEDCSKDSGRPNGCQCSKWQQCAGGGCLEFDEKTGFGVCGNAPTPTPKTYTDGQCKITVTSGSPSDMNKGNSLGLKVDWVNKTWSDSDKKHNEVDWYEIDPDTGEKHYTLSNHGSCTATSDALGHFAKQCSSVRGQSDECGDDTHPCIPPNQTTTWTADKDGTAIIVANPYTWSDSGSGTECDQGRCSTCQTELVRVGEGGGDCETGQILGNVWQDTNRNGNKDSGESNFAGVLMTLSGTRDATVHTDSNGNYQWSNLDFGDYTITASANGYSSTTPNPVSTSIDRCDDQDEANFGLSSSQTATPTPPTGSPTPTPTLIPGGTPFAFNLILQGVGTTAGENNDPKNPQRNLEVKLFDNNNVELSTKTGNIDFSNTTGYFSGTVDMGLISSGAYTIKVKSDRYLRKLIPGIQNITSGTTYSVPSATLVVGDINNDNKLDITDYNQFLGCYNKTPVTSTCESSDLNDDGAVDGIDYNYFIRSLSVEEGD